MSNTGDRHESAILHDSMPSGEVREATVGSSLWIFIDADEPDHPLEKKALIRGKPVEVRQ